MEDFWSFGSTVFEGGFAAFLINALIVWLIATLICRLLKRMSRSLVSLNGYGSATLNQTKMDYFYQTIRAVVYSIAIFMIFRKIIPLQGLGNALLGATSILAVLVGLAAQESFGNYVAGFFLAIYQPFQVGDLVQIHSQNIVGTVKEMTLRHTTIETYNHTLVIVPNSTMNTAVIEDLSSAEYVTTPVSVEVAYGTDVDKVREIITRVVSGQKGSLDIRTEKEKKAGAPRVIVRVNDFLESGIEIRFFVHAKDQGESFSVCAAVREELLKEFQKNGITIPYPTITLSK